MRQGVYKSMVLMAAAICARAQVVAAEPCPQSLSSRTQVELYFGRNIGETLGVDVEAWARFLDEEITPRFPDGLSVIDIDGQWKDRASGRIVREPGKLVVLIVDAFEPARERLGLIVDRYKVRHQQQAVLMTVRPICVSE